MGMLKFGTTAILVFLVSFNIVAQDSLNLSRRQCETLFLNQNLLLMAERLEISKAEAMVLQARLWPNPTVSLEEINLWATPKQLSVFGEELQGFNGGNFGKNQQISFSVEQLILTAGKRKKMMAMEQVSADKSKQYFEELLRNLKVEFRSQLTQLQYLQFTRRIYESQAASVKQLVRAYQKQVTAGNVSKGEYIRLKALELEFSKKINDLSMEINEAQKELKLLMRLPANTQLTITDDAYLRKNESLASLTLALLLDSAKSARPDLKIAEMEQTYFSKLHAYEKAQRVPNLALTGGYDRGGNFMYNFVGFGLTMDLPVFNRNQGNIKHAHLGMEQSRILYEQKSMSVANEIALAYQNLTTSVQFYESIESDYGQTLDELLSAYIRNFTSKNISLLEFIDFLNAYLDNKTIILEAVKEVNKRTEELNFTVGKDIIN